MKTIADCEEVTSVRDALMAFENAVEQFASEKTPVEKQEAWRAWEEVIGAAHQLTEAAEDLAERARKESRRLEEELP